MFLTSAPLRSPLSLRASFTAVDAQKSMRLFHTYFDLHSRPGSWEQACQALLTAPVEMSFARRNPQFEGVCMGNRKTCTCGAPFFS